MKSAAVAVLHEKPVPHFLTHNLIINLQPNSCWIYRAKPSHPLFDQLLAQRWRQGRGKVVRGRSIFLEIKKHGEKG